MAVFVGLETQSSKKIVLPVDADRTTVVLAQEPTNFKLKDAIETPMAQQVCFKPVSLTCLLLYLALY